MKHVSELKGIGKGRSCLLIGGGMSASKIPSLGDVRINCNYPYHGEEVDYVCYYDDVVEDHIHAKGNTGFKTIGFEKCNVKPNADYYAVINEDVEFADSGYHSLQIATKIMNFDIIYLIGYDYRRLGGRQHYYAGAEDNQEIYDKWMFRIAKRRYEYKDCRCLDFEKCECKKESLFDGYNITNLSKDSALECFKKMVIK